MSDFQPFALWPGAELTPAWLRWLGETLRAGGRPPEALPGDPESVLPALDAHGLLPLVYLALRDGPAWQAWPAAGRAALAAAFRANVLRSYLMETELTRIAAALAASGTPVALLKGAATGRTVYDSPAGRPVNDLDLLIPAAAAEEARRAVAALGYAAHGPLGRGRFGRWQRRYRSELQMVCTVPGRQGLLVELHWSLVELPYYVERIPMAEVWAATRPIQGLPGASIPDAAALLLHSCAHLALHHSRNLRLIWLVDVDRLARWEALDWEALTARAERWGLGLATKTALEAAAGWLGAPLPARAMARLAGLAEDPVCRSMWGIGDEQPDRARRRARATWAAFTAGQRARYAAWLALRAVARPFEAARWRQRTGQRTPE